MEAEVAAEAAVAEAVDITAHLGGTADRLTVNWHWRLIGLWMNCLNNLRVSRLSCL